MKTVRKWRGWEEMKNAEQWCFSIGKTDERLLVTVFQQREESERLLVFQQREKLLDGVVSEMRNDEEKADWNVLGSGKK
jgi:hypothetical protein